MLAFPAAALYYCNMYKILRIICSVIGALALAACVFVFVYAGVLWGIITLICAAAFFMLTVFFRNLQLKGEEDASPRGDFITGRRNDDEGQ